MKRRTFMTASAGAALVGAAPAEPAKRAFYHLLYFYLRSGPQVERTTRYLGDVFLPAAKRAGLGPLGFFNAAVGEHSPFILSLVSYPSFAAIETAHNHFAEDKEFEKGWDAYNTGEPAYVRMEGTLLQAFNAMPAIDVPPGDAKRPGRLFELRTYESISEKASRRKVKMFEDGEIGIFRRLGMSPVFFGQSTLVGKNLPNLSYMLAFDDLAARERLWNLFRADPEWKKMSAEPGLNNAEIVSNISNQLLQPLAFSQIR